MKQDSSKWFNLNQFPNLHGQVCEDNIASFKLPDDASKFSLTASTSSLPRRPNKGKDFKEFAANMKEAVENGP